MNPEQKVPCPEIEDQLSAYLDGELSPEEIGAVDTHLADCPRCASILEDLREMIRSAGSLPRLEAPGGFQDRLMAEVRAENLPKARRITPIWFRVGGLAAAASVLLVASLYVGGVIGPRGEREGRETARYFPKAPEAKLEGMPAPAAPAEPTEAGFAAGLGKPAGEVVVKRGLVPAEDAQVLFLAVNSRQKGLIDDLRAYEVADRDKDDGPPPLEIPEAQLWKTQGEGPSRRLTLGEENQVRQAREEQNLLDVSLPQEEADQILEGLSKAGVKILLMTPPPEDAEEEERIEGEKEPEPELDGKAEKAKEVKEAREMLGRLQDRGRKMRDDIERARSESGDAREVLEYFILRIFIARDGRPDGDR